MKVVFVSVVWLIRRSLLGLIALFIGIAAFEMIQPVALRSFGDLDRLQPFLTLVPPSFWTLMNVTPDFLGSAGLAGYLSLGYTHPAFLILSSATVIWFSGRILAGELERGSIQFSLSRPISRLQLYGSRLLATMLVVCFTAAIGPIGMGIGVLLARPEGPFAFGHLAVVGVLIAALIWAIGGIALALSASSDTMSRALGVGIGLLVVSYVVDYFAALWSVLKPLAPFSVFHYYQPAAAIANGVLSGRDLMVLGAIGLVGAIAGGVIFVRRDLPV